GEAWNKHDPAEIVACFVEGGTYSDPVVPQGVAGGGPPRYAPGVFASFPDGLFCVERASASRAGGGGLPRATSGDTPGGRTGTLPGVDLIQVEGDKIRSVRGYFDQLTMLQQLGVIPPPNQAG